MQRGLFQLKKLRIRYCDWGGSSAGVREFLQDGQLSSFQAQNPQLLIERSVKRNKHPILVGEYVNGKTKEICVRNRQPDDVHRFVEQLFTHSGVTRDLSRGPQVTKTPSIQGKWSPFLEIQ